MTRLLELLVAIIIVLILGVLLGVALPDHRHVERSVVVSSPVSQVYDVVDGFRTYPSWNALQAFDPKVQMNLEGPPMGPGAKLDWHSTDEKIGNGSLTIAEDPAPKVDQQVTWSLVNNWMGQNKKYTIDLEPSDNGKTVKVTMGFDVDYGWDLIGRYAGMYLEGVPATEIQLQLTRLQNMLATFPDVDYKDQNIQLKDVTGSPIIYVSTTAKRTLDDIADATNKAVTELQAAAKKAKASITGQRITITTNWGDQNYDFDVAFPIDSADAKVSDPVKVGTSYTGKALETTFTGSPAQLPLARLMLKAYAYTHGYVFDESSEGSGRFYDIDTTTDAAASPDQQSYTVYLPIQPIQSP